MGGKKTNPKADSAKAEKEMEANNKKSAAAAAAEDATWETDGPKKGKKDAKKAGKDEDRAAAAAKKLESKAMAAAEDEAMANYGKKAPKKDGEKVTAAQRAAKREEEANAQSEMVAKKKQESRREVAEEDYGKMVGKKHDNRAVDVDASGIDAAVSALEIGSTDSDAHPERRRKAAYAEYAARMTVELKEEQPNLKMSQYKEIIFKSWKKAPENPMNQT